MNWTIERICEEELPELEKTWTAELLERGEAYGAARGELKAYREILLNKLERRFVKLPEAIVQRIASAGLEKLKTAMTQAGTIGSPEDLKF